jgi:hypothetical protein
MRISWRMMLLLVLTGCAHAGGPEFVAGVSYFDPIAKGNPLTWPQPFISYFTDQGDLSPVLLGPNADALVANAFGAWNAIPTSAIMMLQSGHLAEDVSGANLTLINGAITGPADITPTATSTAVGVVYDQDGSVVDALLGSGASNSVYCAGNSVLGGVDNLDVSGHFSHALIILNGAASGFAVSPGSRNRKNFGSRLVAGKPERDHQDSPARCVRFLRVPRHA